MASARSEMPGPQSTHPATAARTRSSRLMTATAMMATQSISRVLEVRPKGNSRHQI